MVEVQGQDQGQNRRNESSNRDNTANLAIWQTLGYGSNFGIKYNFRQTSKRRPGGSSRPLSAL